VPPETKSKWRHVTDGYIVTITGYMNHGNIDLVTFKAPKKIMGMAHEMGWHQPAFRAAFEPVDTIQARLL